jgi:hypothetical protein
MIIKSSLGNYLKTLGSAGEVHASTYRTYPITLYSWSPGPIQPCKIFLSWSRPTHPTSWFTTAVKILELVAVDATDKTMKGKYSVKITYSMKS